MKKATFTLVELMVAASIMAVVIMALFSVILSSSTLQLESREARYATSQVNAMIEQIRAYQFEAAFLYCNSVSVTDIEGLDGKNPVGTYKFITNENVIYYSEGWDAHEEDENRVPDEVTAKLGLPMDLNGNGTVSVNTNDANIITSTLDPPYLLLPVVVRVSWDTASGRTKVEIPLMLSNR